ncbi:DUF3037 domain-containing protein [Chloroflexus sp.]|uniref:DUF3037 domain-containing protein n=1 Tax=Chloroflexus sp. TaxID=1904827 RepID=UPI00298F3A07|nr:DUF3037 domain-containing protein [Chloroflexus sp.]MCS6886726.1 DUF3037 domain-containing protein [Chloroflexus sp.]MDW8405211.1 DUF3037 domain-containing protein [Chloroflexus sp.]
MPASAFEYALLRLVPRVERGEQINIGVVLLCRQQRFLGMRAQLDEGRIAALWPDLDLEPVREQLAAFELVCAGGAAAGPIGELPIYERFRWLTATRSTIIQPSAVHCGLCEQAAAMLAHIFAEMVLVPSGVAAEEIGENSHNEAQKALGQ